MIFHSLYGCEKCHEHSANVKENVYFFNPEYFNLLFLLLWILKKNENNEMFVYYIFYNLYKWKLANKIGNICHLIYYGWIFNYTPVLKLVSWNSWQNSFERCNINITYKCEHNWQYHVFDHVRVCCLTNENIINN